MQKKKVLLVDDNKVSRKVLSIMIRQYVLPGCLLTEAADGQEAIDILRKNGNAVGFDIVITDFEMPRRDGVDLIMSIAEMKVKKPPQIIVITGERNVFLARLNGRTDNLEFMNRIISLEKPATYEELHKAIAGFR